MKTYTVISFLLLHFLNEGYYSKDGCPSISDGRYTMRYLRNSIEPQSVVEIKQGRYLKYVNQKIQDSGAFVSLGNCYFQFRSDVFTYLDTSGLTGLMNRSFGAACIEATKFSPDTTWFRTTYTGNLHISQNFGQLIKIENRK